MKNLFNLFLFLLFSFQSFSQPTAYQIKEIDNDLQDLYKNQKFNGVVLFAKNGSPIYKKAFGVANFKSNEPLKFNSSFNLASVSKQFFAMMIMQLKEAGKLNYDDKLAMYFPEFPYKKITIRHLLQHTSGLPEYFDFAEEHLDEDEILTNKKLLALLVEKKPKLNFEPGTKWEYSNTGYALLTNIIEKTSKMAIEDYFRVKIAQPLGLKDSFVFYQKIKTNTSAGHQRVYGFEVKKGKKYSNDLTNMDGVVGDGNLYSSVEDLLKWDQALYTNKLVSLNALKEAFTSGSTTNGEEFGYGFGWEIDENNKIVSHTGSWVGFENFISRNMKTKTTVIILSSSSNDAAIDVINEILEK
ncbi:serine hydrolase domain-containing protein [Lacihabitans soyangensis]|uniref:Class A beta-lactamase-related serine hydrolase n=1 Tax=Lacihabitans soyangensis TaxID=869394 RepID=A0AAE3KV98_9BACT|nr:serine hydrolase domain-containing protein [Lacihabitans soyangensis]MCP9763971.1 class A beta-lactamase-related serine hydrolase [Lacihabitans soyangensis]